MYDGDDGVINYNIYFVNDNDINNDYDDSNNNDDKDSKNRSNILDKKETAVAIVEILLELSEAIILKILMAFLTMKIIRRTITKIQG